MPQDCHAHVREDDFGPAHHLDSLHLQLVEFVREFIVLVIVRGNCVHELAEKGDEVEQDGLLCDIVTLEEVCKDVGAGPDHELHPVVGDDAAGHRHGTQSRANPRAVPRQVRCAFVDQFLLVLRGGG